MAAGTWMTQNKTRPGVYIRFRSALGMGLTVGDRGIVAICEPMSWGAPGQVMTLEAGMDTTPFCGHDITRPQARFLNEIFKGTNRTAAPNKVLLYRPAATGSMSASAKINTTLTVTAKYPGVRGNDIVIVITEDVDNEGAFTITTAVDGGTVDVQTGKTISDLMTNDWVTFSGSGALAAATGAPLTGGADGTVSSAAYSAFLASIEPYRFDILVYDGADATVGGAMISFVKRMCEENGQYCQLVASGLSNPDCCYVINVKNGVVLSDGITLTAAQTCWWAGGAQAGAMYNQSLTYASYPGAVKALPVLTNSETIAAIQAGELILTGDNGVIKVETDINSLVTYTPKIGKVYRKNRVMRLCNSIANDIYQQFSENFVGVVNNNDTGRALFKSAIVGYLLTLQGTEAIQNFTADDVQVLPGDEIDSIVVNLAVQAVDSVEKIYMTVTVS